MGFSRQEYWSGLPFPSPGLVVILIAIPPVIIRVAEHPVFLLNGFYVFFSFIPLKGESEIYLFPLAS